TKKPKPKNTTATNHHLLPQDLLSLVTSAISATHSFPLYHDLLLLPSQLLSLHSLLSSSRSLLSLPSPSPPPPAPFSSWFHRLLFSSCTIDNDPRWVRFFHISKPTFSLLLSLLSPSLPPSVSPGTALAASLFRLSHGASYKSLARLFGFDSSADACRVFYSVCKAVNDKLGNLVDFSSDIGRILGGFGWISLPNCCGVLGFGRFGVDVEVLGSNGSVLVQALVDSEGRFLDISAGWPCTMKPESILRQTKLYTRIEDSRELLNGPCYELSDGNSIPQYILGDSSFPLSQWLLTPYSWINEEDSFGSAEREFNCAHSRAMGLVSTAFGRVKCRWKLLSKRWSEGCVEFLPVVIFTGCLLHNFIINCSEPLMDDYVGCSREEKLPIFEGEVVDESGQRIRDALALHLSR
ncbi:DDE_4 domain-containing protein, partial [Cephalotus follicularis]